MTSKKGLNLNENQIKRWMKLADNDEYSKSFLKESEERHKGEKPKQMGEQPYNGDVDGVGTPYSEKNDKKTEPKPSKVINDPLDGKKDSVNEGLEELEEELYKTFLNEIDGFEDEEEVTDVEIDDEEPSEVETDFNPEQEPEEFGDDEMDAGGEPAEMGLGTGELNIPVDTAVEVAKRLVDELDAMLPVELSYEVDGAEGEMEPMDDMGVEEPMDDMGVEEPMDDMGVEEPEEEDEEEDFNNLSEAKIKKIARNLVNEVLKQMK
jgi:hypothetical protein